jgi:imidazolonepropionase-like amidohydrolase
MRPFVAGLIISVGLLSGSQAADAPAHGIAFTNVSIIDTIHRTTRSGMTVVIKGDRIVDVQSVGRIRIPSMIDIVDASGKFLIPGLWDMHVHTFFDEELGQHAREITLPLFIAAGVTGVRDMGSDLAKIVATRKEIEEHRLLGPRMVIAGPMLDGPASQYSSALKIASPDEGRRAVDMLKAAGVDFIKVQSLVPRDAYFAIADWAKKRHIPLDGHVPDAVRAAEAVNAKQRSFEHLIGIFEGSPAAEEAFLTGQKSPGRFLATYDSSREQSLARLLANHHTWQCPTQYWERVGQLIDTFDSSADEDVKYVPASWHEKTWPKWTASLVKTFSDSVAVRTQFLSHELNIIRRLHRAGVPISRRDRHAHRN